MSEAERAIHVSIVAIPEAAVSTLTGIFDVLNAFGFLAGRDSSIPVAAPFNVEIVGERSGPLRLASGLPVEVQRNIDDIKLTDILIVPSVLLDDSGWQRGRYSKLVSWIAAMHARGAILCSACSGIFLLAETGLFDGQQATIHWAYEDTFKAEFPAISLFPDRVLMVAGEREDLVTSGASTTWHDLVLYLVARFVGPTAAQTIARFFALQWHRDGIAPYIVLDRPVDHEDAAISNAQAWLRTHVSVARPVEEMIKISGLTERTFKRRFKAAVRCAPIDYVQRLRIEDAKRRLERSDAPIDEISWQVGYEDPAFFRRLFKRMTQLAPGAYRKKFQIPEFARRQGTGLS
jgi:transcriptional regulator GlxA family with amidase domain